jgi:hypothetical protein
MRPKKHDISVEGFTRHVAKGINAMLRVSLLVVLLGIPVLAQAVEYRCKVEKKFDFENIYSQNQIEKGQFSVLVEEKGVSAFLSRCSFTSSAQKVTCDRYEVDKTVFDENVKAKKYYVLRSHFDVQVFSDLSFIENNGRGGIAFGKCSVVAP